MHRFFQALIYFAVLTDVLMFIYAPKLMANDSETALGLEVIVLRFSQIFIYQNPVFSRLLILLLISLVSIGTLSKKDAEIHPEKSIVLPLSSGLLCMFFSLLFLEVEHAENLLYNTTVYDIAYMVLLFAGTLLFHLAMDNVSKLIHSSFGKDRWNTEEESFMQQTQPAKGKFAVCIPSLFLYRKRIHAGFINIENIFRGTLLIGTPGSGKSFGVVMPFIRQLINKEFCLCLYDFKFPDLAQIAFYHFLKAQKAGKMADYGFYVINLTQVEKSCRINVLHRDYIQTLADANETAEALVEALKKGDKSGGSDQFFTQSAVNFLASCIYFLAQHEHGRYSTFPHVLAFLNSSYEDIFTALFSNAELRSLLSPFASAWKAKAFNQLEGQIGTLKVFISRLATKETFWVFSGDDFNLKISGKNSPAILILANDPNTQNINSACYSVVLNRLTRLINSKGNRPSALIIDEVPTLFVHRIENLIATARSNRVAVLMGLQELPQFQQQYGKETASTITSVIGNVLSGSVRNKDTLDWLERIFGKVKQRAESLSIDRSKTSISLSEKLEPLIPAGKIAALKAGELVGILAADVVEEYTGKFETSAINCRVNLDMKAIPREENAYPEMPVYYDFGVNKDKILKENFKRINDDVKQLFTNIQKAQKSAGK